MVRGQVKKIILWRPLHKDVATKNHILEEKLYKIKKTKKLI
jgi:hypothetical protein